MNEKDFLSYIDKIESKIKNSMLSEFHQLQTLIVSQTLKQKQLSEIKLGLEEQSINEKIAVTTSSPKLHALFFDRIDCQGLVGISGSEIPWEYVNRLMTYESCLFYYLNYLAITLMKDSVFEEVRGDADFAKILTFLLTEAQKFGLLGTDTCPYAIDKESMVRRQSEELRSLYKASAIPIYSSTDEFIKGFEEGSQIVTQRVIDNLSIVDEKKLEWKQVKQFREDRESRHKYAEFLEFLKSKWAGQNIDYYSYKIESKYHEYNESLKKHGVKTRLGAFKDIFSAKFILPSSLATITSSLTFPELAPVVAGFFAIGTLSLTLAEYKLNLSTVNPPDESIAWIYELKKRVN